VKFKYNSSVNTHCLTDRTVEGYSPVKTLKTKNSSSVNPHCLSDRAAEGFSPVKPLKMEKIIGLTVVYRKPILPQFFHDLSNSLKTKFR
jgi:hypothetical protein